MNFSVVRRLRISVRIREASIIRKRKQELENDLGIRILVYSSKKF
jgi:hypothetical protein